MSNPTDWTKFASLRVVALFAALVLIFYAIVFYIAIPSKKNIEFFGLKVKNQDTMYIAKTNTVTLTKDSIIFVPKVIQAPCPPVVSQKNKNGDNYDVKAGGDISGHVGPTYSELSMDEGSKQQLLSLVNNAMTQYKIKNKRIFFGSYSGSNLGKFASQARQVLESEGFEIVDWLPLGTPCKGYTVAPRVDDALEIDFGYWNQ